MSKPDILSAAASKEASLPRRDWILLPALSLLTIIVVAVCTQLIAIWIFPTYGDMKTCLVLDDRSTGVRGVPNCVCGEKIPEGQPVEYRFNGCGDYTAIECGPKRPGVYRIVMTGTSFPTGVGVERESTFAALLPKELSRRTGRKVELYNESLPRKSPRIVALRFNETLAAKPDLILWVLDFSDVQLASLVVPADYGTENTPAWVTGEGDADSGGSSVVRSLARFREKAKFETLFLLHKANDKWRDTRSYVLMTHFIAVNESQSQFLKRNRTGESKYLDAEPSPGRLSHLREFDKYAAGVGDRAKAAGVPFVAVFVPSRILAAMISNGQWPPDLDPYKLDGELRSIIVSHGGTYIDILPDYRTIPNPEQGFYPADGHFNSEGHAQLSGLLAKELTSGAVPELAVSTQPPAHPAQGR
jgi:hypothetical protein